MIFFALLMLNFDSLCEQCRVYYIILIVCFDVTLMSVYVCISCYSNSVCTCMYISFYVALMFVLIWHDYMLSR